MKEPNLTRMSKEDIDEIKIDAYMSKEQTRITAEEKKRVAKEMSKRDWKDKEQTPMEELLSIVEEFIGSIDNKTYNKIRSSQGDAECRRYLKEHLRKQLDLFDVSERNEQLKCQCRKAQFTRTVDADFNPLCGRCGKAL